MHFRKAAAQLGKLKNWFAFASEPLPDSRAEMSIVGMVRIWTFLRGEVPRLSALPRENRPKAIRVHPARQTALSELAGLTVLARRQPCVLR